MASTISGVVFLRGLGHSALWAERERETRAARTSLACIVLRMMYVRMYFDSADWFTADDGNMLHCTVSDPYT